MNGTRISQQSDKKYSSDLPTSIYQSASIASVYATLLSQNFAINNAKNLNSIAKSCGRIIKVQPYSMMIRNSCLYVYIIRQGITENFLNRSELLDLQNYAMFRRQEDS